MGIYDGYRMRYDGFGNTDFGAGSNTLYHIIGPKGKEGLLWDYGVYAVMEAFAAGTTTPMMSIGTVADPDHYGDEFDFGALAVAGGGKSIRTTYAESATGFGTYMLIRNLPADTVILITCVAGTGSGLTGMASPFVDIIWQD